jgi:hypothetical protein
MNFGLPLESDYSTAVFIERNFHNMKQTLVEDTMRSAFM